MAQARFQIVSEVQGKGLDRFFSKLNKVSGVAKKLGSVGKKAGQALKNTFNQTNNVLSKTQAAAKKVMGVVKQLAGAFNMVGGAAKMTQRALKGMASMLMRVRDGYMAVVDSARLVTQGFTNFGRSMFFFVSLPLLAFFKNLSTAVIDFDDQLVRVGKTTGLWGEDLRQVGMDIRDLARNTSTSHVDLATMAEQIGQLGFSSREEIVPLLDLFNQLAITTNIAADEVATKMGKIGKAFGWTEDFIPNIRRLANTMNYLENTTAASADEILDALFKTAAVAGTLGMSAADATAFATALVSTGFSAEEAGTAVRNLSYYMANNREEIAQAMKGYEKYNTVQKVTNALNEDFTQVIIDISDAMEDGDDSVMNLVQAIEIGNLRGGKALAAFGNSFENMTKIIQDANAEWERANSLAIEYEKAMTSTKAQMGLLRNNIQDVGMTFGEAILPIVNKIIMVLVPAIRELNDWFMKLNDQTKLQYVALALIVIAAGPVVMFLGQMAHGVTLLLMGFGQFIKVIVWVLRAFSSLAGGVSTISKVFGFLVAGVGKLGSALVAVAGVIFSTTGLWIAAIIAAVVGILIILQKFGVDVAGFFENIAKKASEWGANLMETYGNGLAKGAMYVIQVITWVANAIASFFRAFSPPKKGPLSTIDKWGGKLMSTYLKGFYLADFDILSGVGRIIERYLTFGKKGDDSAMASALRNTLKARGYLAQLIDIYNKTGVVDQGLLAKTTKGLGHMTEHVQKLIGLWLEYNRLQQRIKELEEERKDVVRGYQEEVEGISGSNMSLEDKVNAIRQAQFARDDELRAIDKEKAALEEQSEEMEDQLKWQQKFVDAMMDQDDMVARLNSTLEKLSSKLEGLGGLGGDIGGELGEAIAEFEESIEGLQERLSKGSQLWDMFKKGFMGEEVDWYELFKHLDPEDYENFRQMYEMGEKVGNVWNTLVGVWESLEDWGGRIAAAWETAGSIFDSLKSFFTGLSGGEGSGITANIQSWIDFFDNMDWEQFEDWYIEKLRTVLGRVWGAILSIFFDDDSKAAELGERWADIMIDVALITERLSELWHGILGSAWTNVKTWIAENTPQWATDLFTLYSTMFTTFKELILPEMLENGKQFILGLWDGIKLWVETVLPWITTKIEGIIDAIKKVLGIESPSTIMYDIGVDIIEGLIDGLESMWQSVTSWFTDLASRIPGWVKTALGIESPSKVMMELGKQTMEGYLIGVSGYADKIRHEVSYATAQAPLGVSALNAGGGTAGIQVIINDPVVRDDSDLDRLAQLVSDRIAEQLNAQQAYGGQTTW